MYYSDFLVDCRFSIINLLVCLGVIEQLKEKYRVDLDEGVYHTYTLCNYYSCVEHGQS